MGRASIEVWGEYLRTNLCRLPSGSSCWPPSTGGLLAARGQTWNEGMGRITAQFTFTSAALVVLALVIQQRGYDGSFRAIAIALGAAVRAINDFGYFDGSHAGSSLVVLVCWFVVPRVQHRAGHGHCRGSP